VIVVPHNRITDRHQVSAALADPAFTIPPVPDGGPVGGIRWLRRNVARFADGAVHQRRRQLVTAMLDELAPAELRTLAEERTRAVFDDGPVDVMARVARVVPVEVLAAALDLPVPVADVAVVAKAYQPGGEERHADQAVARLVEVLGGAADEVTAARIGLLVQTCDATAGLIGNAVLTMLRADRRADEIVAGTLRWDPPVRATRRLAAGTVVTIDLEASGFPFGSGHHRCPGREHAVAIAEGVIEAVRGCRLVEPYLEYEPSPVLRIPARLVLSRRPPGTGRSR
jgi:cytochrome P450